MRFVDVVLLDREDYAELRATIAQQISTEQTIDAVLDTACARFLASPVDRRWTVAEIILPVDHHQPTTTHAA